MKKLLLASTLLLSIGAVQASDSPKWNKIEASYQKLDADGDDLSGFGVAGTALIGGSFFTDLSYRTSSDTFYAYDVKAKIEYNVLSIGAGYKMPISTSTDLFGVISYEEVELVASAAGISEDTSGDGLGGRVGIRSMLSEQFELSGSVQYIKIEDESETGLELSGYYHFTNQMSLGLAYHTIGEMNTMSIKAAYYF
jgi:hypothetical protein